MSAVFSLDQVLACTESATSEYSITSQCLGALLGRSGRWKFILNGLRWREKKPTHQSLPYDYCLATHQLVVINTAATKGGEEIHSRGGGGPVRKDQFPLKKIQKKEKSRNPQESLNVSIHSPLILAGILTSSRERGCCEGWERTNSFLRRRNQTSPLRR